MGSWGVLGPALLSLAGVVLGVGGSLFGQLFVSRAGAQQFEVEASAAHRAQLREAVLGFVAVALRVEKVAFPDSRGDGSVSGAGPAPVAACVPGELLHELWLAQAGVDLAAGSEALRGAAYRYARCLAESAGGEASDEAVLRGAQVEFMDAAYEDMWPGRPRVAAG
ncbi:hypothetical protein GPA10_38540 [Streptomyces sp. p1417]|uniref:Uncharacterized protein n=1 Tax=Streptomyces typhae TaxID=2681492 RepID=A0A6L6X9F7_9ACTN|nr:hypothetical protein [Streptomyces typhae]MVO90494.1 hypothetical protein [Streptomyces typhae]